MEIKCEYCGAYMSDTDEKCPNCGAINKNHKRVADNTPKTIEELKQWYKDRNLPPYEKTRFFIGMDYKKPKAFGIYEENGNFIVYKNKADGSRAVRYQGRDEAYAVNELYLKLKSEILNQKAHQTNPASTKGMQKLNKKRAISNAKTIGWVVCLFMGMGGIGLMGPLGVAKFVLFLLAPLLLYYLVIVKITKDRFKPYESKLKIAYIAFLVIVFFALVSKGIKSTTPHYYSYDNSVYCLYDDEYYEYDYYSNDYVPVNQDYLPVEIVNNGPDYEFNMDGTEWDSSYTFEDSDYYDDNLRSTHEWSFDGDSSSSSDSSYDWDSGSDWDSG